ncbi:rCG42944, isoform CRA_b [Rattus norvegicus]|uniref:RCG42944, isoform CRA_b n=1 Tax=Rattus norvegicus TaxID=10116 RepID=A6JZY5_RAT|nr:rCG42944, isoform CRA_b [Rattus norvegicus]
MVSASRRSLIPTRSSGLDPASQHLLDSILRVSACCWLQNPTF